jgi:cation:H+ antiporter
MPEWILSLVLLITGFAAIVAGGGLLLRSTGALTSRLPASAERVNRLLMPLVWAAPGLTLTLQAAFAGASGLVAGYCLGAGVAGLLLVPGVLALAAPRRLPATFAAPDLRLLIALLAGVWLVAVDGRLGRLDGALLCSALAIYLLAAAREGRLAICGSADHALAHAGVRASNLGLWLSAQTARLLAGLLLLLLGARLLVMAAADVALILGVSGLLVGLSLLVLGVGLPQMLRCVLKLDDGGGQGLARGIPGGVLLNLVGGLGLAALLAPQGIAVAQDALAKDLPVLILAVLGSLAVLGAEPRISRGLGVGMLAYYAVYLLYLALRGIGSPLTGSFEILMLGGALPLTAMRLWRGLRSRVR